MYFLIIWSCKRMCSTFKFKNCVGRNFDYDVSYKEQIIQIPKYQYYNIYDIIGVASGITDEYPLMYDGMNEKGLVCTALAFNGNAYYEPLNSINDKKKSVAIRPYEFVFGILSRCDSVDEVKKLLNKSLISDESYSDELQNSDLHWFIADEKESIIVEQTKNGLKIYDGSVMTNNPPYNLQVELCDIFSQMIGDLPFKALFKYSSYETRGLETINLNGDYTSFGRFERLTYLKNNLEKNKNSFDEINQSFHLLGSVEQIYGSTPVDDGFEYTIYSVVYDMKDLVMYVKPYYTYTLVFRDMNFENEERWDL